MSSRIIIKSNRVCRFSLLVLRFYKRRQDCSFVILFYAIYECKCKQTPTDTQMQNLHNLHSNSAHRDIKTTSILVYTRYCSSAFCIEMNVFGGVCCRNTSLNAFDFLMAEWGQCGTMLNGTKKVSMKFFFLYESDRKIAEKKRTTLSVGGRKSTLVDPPISFRSTLQHIRLAFTLISFSALAIAMVSYVCFCRYVLCIYSFHYSFYRRQSTLY